MTFPPPFLMLAAGGLSATNNGNHKPSYDFTDGHVIAELNYHSMNKSIINTQKLTALKVHTLVASHVIHAGNGWGRWSVRSGSTALVDILIWYVTFVGWKT